jgi:hypothetical protein
VRDDDRAAHHEAEHVRRRRSAGAGDLLVEDRLLDQGGAAAAVLLGPGEAGPATVVELLLPRDGEIERVVVATRSGARVVGFEPGSKLVSEFRF